MTWLACGCIDIALHCTTLISLLWWLFEDRFCGILELALCCILILFVLQHIILNLFHLHRCRPAWVWTSWQWPDLEHPATLTCRLFHRRLCIVSLYNFYLQYWFPCLPVLPWTYMYILCIHVRLSSLQVLHGEGNVLLSHADAVISCLEKCVHLKCRTAAQHAAKVRSTHRCQWISTSRYYFLCDLHLWLYSGYLQCFALSDHDLPPRVQKCGLGLWTTSWETPLHMGMFKIFSVLALVGPCYHICMSTWAAPKHHWYSCIDSTTVCFDICRTGQLLETSMTLHWSGTLPLM